MVFGRIQIDEQVIHLVQNFLGASVRTVNLIDHQNGFQLGFERLGQHVARLGQRALAGIDEQHDAVDNLERALNLAAEIRVARGIDNVNLYVVEAHARGFSKNRNAAFAFEIVRIHGAFALRFVGPVNTGLAEHGVNQRGLSVVDVRNNSNVTNLLIGF